MSDTTEWVEVDDWGTVKVGDRVEARTDDGAIIPGKVEFIFTNDDHTDGHVGRITIDCASLEEPVDIRYSEWDLFIPAKPAVGLDEPGFYSDKDGNGIVVYQWRTTPLPESQAPYVKLEPVHETAKKVIDWCASRPGINPDMVLWLNARRQFGVTDD